MGGARIRIVPVRRAVVRRLVAEHHRHARPPESYLFACGLERDGDELIGVACAGRPLARSLDDGLTIEVTRVVTLGDRNASSQLYGALLRAATALGYRRAITYTLEHESGASLRAVGFVEVERGIAKRYWTSSSRPRYASTLFGEPTTPDEPRVRWERLL